MSIEIDIASGPSTWPAVAPLLNAVWPPEAVQAQPWGHLAFAPADLRVMIETPENGVICQVGIVRRQGTWNGRKVLIGGMTGIATHENFRRRGYASLALNAAIHTLTEERATDFGMLFCDPANAAFFEARGWQTFNGRVHAEQDGARARFELLVPYVFRIRRLLREGTIDLCGLPW